MKYKDNIRSLNDIPGIGEKMTRRFIEHFGTEQNALEAILSGDVASISCMEGVGQRYAISLVQEVSSKMEGVKLQDFLKTREAMDIYERLLDIIKLFAHTGYAREKMHTFFPYPASRRDRIESIRNSVSQHIEHADILKGNEGFLCLLSGVKPLNLKQKPVRIRDRVILTTDPKRFEKAKRRFGDYLDVHLVSSLTDIVDSARGYSHVIATDDDLFSCELPEDVEIEIIADLEACEDWKIVPENEIFQVSRNLRVIESSIQVTRIIRISGMPFLQEVDDTTLNKLEKAIWMIDENGDVRGGIDPEIDRLAVILEGIDAAVASANAFANQELGNTLKESQLVLSGQDMLRMMHDSSELKSVLENQLRHNYVSVMEKARKNICTTLSLQKKEILLLDALFPQNISHPVEADRTQVTVLKQYVKERIAKRKIEHKRQVACSLMGLRETIQKMVKEVLDFDVGFTIGCFASEYGLSLPRLIEGTGIGLKNAENLFLKSRHGTVVPIDYTVGDTSFSPKEDNSRVVLLSGVNSGGKTSLLELLAQCIILTHMGFPVPAAAMEVGLTDGFYYFAKSKGTLDAGAFETTLIDFSVVSDGSGKIVLVDELESITEPGASARIISGILEMLSENEKSLAVFVSHLSELILENTQSNVRVDGIEASGLDCDLNLIVDRTPRYNYVARSTPELIVERLLRRTNGNEHVFYEKLKSKF
ncbi:helix-hairpin-helix domain-containing protein [uncultured Methanomethylovorans sp.]|uniref:MutS-related protein n=1 Tax=uncultured Methanomethylovorans sp. TaxID=183759 RepID=UPI002AA769C0|nr:helix-hairpin-helix domain-containing protein [uncultured Methanomethylovorans sp.]